MRIFVYLSLFWLASCSPATWEEIRFEGEAEIRKFAAELKQIESKEDLQKSLPKIKKRFNKMADLLIKIGDFQKKSLLQTMRGNLLWPAKNFLWRLHASMRFPEAGN